MLPSTQGYRSVDDFSEIIYERSSVAQYNEVSHAPCCRAPWIQQKFDLYYTQCVIICARYRSMSRQRPVLFPKHQRLLEQLGENLRLARKRRKLTTSQVAERAGISRSTLYHLEKGDANSSLAVLLQVLVALKLENDLSKLASDDELGRKLADIQLLKTGRKPGKSP